jgi:lipid-A-disaccharide synthase
MIVAGEASGDAHAAKLVLALRAIADREIEFFGAVSHKLRECGVEEIVNADQLSIVGLPEIARALPTFWSAFKRLREAAIERRPDVAIVVDFPDFNLKLAKSLKRLGIKVIYYISPQIWAWRKHRLRAIKRDVDLLLTILPFEREWYREHGFDRVEFVGNPTIREVHPESSRDEFCAKHAIDAARPLVALLPGSRHKEISRILPVMLRTASRLSETRPELQFVIALASARNADEVDEAFHRSGVARGSIDFATVHGETYDALHASDAAAVTSGTATLETAIIGTPMAIVYKTSPLNYRLLRPLIKVEFFGLINLIADEPIASELIQDDFTPETLGDEILRILEPSVNGVFRKKLAGAMEKLGRGGASKRAAEVILLFLDPDAKNRQSLT